MKGLLNGRVEQAAFVGDHHAQGLGAEPLRDLVALHTELEKGFHERFVFRTAKVGGLVGEAKQGDGRANGDGKNSAQEEPSGAGISAVCRRCLARLPPAASGSSSGLGCHGVA